MPRSNAPNRPLDARALAPQRLDTRTLAADLEVFASCSLTTPDAMHFFPCGVCGQMIDARELGEVLYHESQNHKPLAMN